jgi:hypothetical protein
MQKSLPEKLSQEIIHQSTKEELVELVIRQQEVIEKLNKKIAEGSNAKKLREKKGYFFEGVNSVQT